MTTYEYYRPDTQGENCIDTFHDLQCYKDVAIVEKICETRFTDWGGSCPDVLRIRKQGETEWKEYYCQVEFVPKFTALRKIIWTTN